MFEPEGHVLRVRGHPVEQTREPQAVEREIVNVDEVRLVVVVVVVVGVFFTLFGDRSTPSAATGRGANRCHSTRCDAVGRCAGSSRPPSPPQSHARSGPIYSGANTECVRETTALSTTCAMLVDVRIPFKAANE